jgi:alpha-amylase
MTLSLPLRAILSALLASALLAPAALLVGCSSAEAPATTPDKPAKPRGGKAPGAAFVHLFEWKWGDVARECERFLGPHGFAAVQVSPPSENAVLAGYPWWQRYQVASYDLVSRSGDESEFRDMVSRCNAAGVDVYVDAIINHVSAQASGVGANGTTFTKYEYGDLYHETDFHSPHCVIAGTDYAENADHVRKCELLGLADLNTGAPNVQQKIADYLIRLVDMGVHGFRIDAAKHMAPEDLQAIVQLVSDAVGADHAPYYFFEIIDQGNEAISAKDYLDVAGKSGSTIDITEFKYARIDDSFLSRNDKTLSTLADLTESSWALLPSDRAVVFTNNHDTQRNDAIFYQDGALHDLANVFLLAFPYGYPQLISSFAFDRSTDAGRSEGPPSDDKGHTNSIHAAGSDAPNCAPSPATAQVGQWVCEHRARPIVNMLAFRRATAGTAVTHVWQNGANQLALGRERKGFVVLNHEAMALDRTFATDLPVGKYCDVLAGDAGDGKCSGPTIDVAADGSALIHVGSDQAAAFHVDAVVK